MTDNNLGKRPLGWWWLLAVPVVLGAFSLLSSREAADLQVGMELGQEPAPDEHAGMDMGQDPAPGPADEHAGMDMGQSPNPAAPSQGVGMEMGGAEGSGFSEIVLPPAIVQEVGITTTMATRGLLASEVNAVGRVVTDETTLTAVTVRFPGWVVDVPVATGESVRRGDTLLTIYSPEVLATEKEVLLAMEAAERLAATGDPDVARGTAALVAAALERLRLWDVPSEEVARLLETGLAAEEIAILAPADGVVLSRHAVDGMRATPGMLLFSLADLSEVWVEAALFEADLPLVAVGAEATITLDYLPGRTWSGKVDFIYPMVNPTTRAASAHLRLPNYDGALLPGMYASARILSAPEVMVSVPLDVVIRTGERDIVFVEIGPGRYRPILVEVGRALAGRYEVLSGLMGGETVVMRAAFLLDSETSTRTGAMGGMGGMDMGN